MSPIAQQDLRHDASAISTLAEAIIVDGYSCRSEEARSLLDIEAGSGAASALFAGAQRIRDHFLGKALRFCSILNAKAGNCSEDCSYCSQAKGSGNQDYDKHKWMNDEEILDAAASAVGNGAQAMALVAAWKGIKEGSQLDMVCDSIRELSKEGRLRTDVNLGTLESQACADAIADAGARVYGHNLETARSFFPETCTTHDFEERWNTIAYIKKAGMGLCSGGIIGLGENRDQRIEFAEQLRYIEPQMIPVNFVNPLPGTALEDKPLVGTDEALITLATYRFFLPQSNIMVAGGKEVTFGERLGEVFDAGINAVMVGNYLTTLGTDPDFWVNEARQRGLIPPVDLSAEERACGCGGCC